MIQLHVIYSEFNSSQVKILEKYGIKVQAKYDRFDIEENETFWKIKPYLDEWGVTDFVISKFSDKELNVAERLVYTGVWANGYPMNDYDNGYKKTTYDDSDYCNTCGIGLRQKQPFRLKKEPNWGNNKNMFSLNWIYDELFVKNSFYEEVFRELNIKVERVLLYKKETTIENTVQLVIPSTEISLDLDQHQYEICKVCNRKRYNLISSGFFPPFKENVGNVQIFKSKEWFGTGANARKYIFISAELRKKLVKAKVKVTYIPQQLSCP